ncbi:MAG: 7-cyano-7-deazaguanine synthase [Deltaproteobacteria bacterium]|nr:7-cyano-7-deazaguanine synthase [Deltaproteobacteria bacterium]
MRRKGRIAVLTSGGFDSNILLSELLKQYQVVYPIYIRCGFVWEKAELYWLRRYLTAIKHQRLRALTLLESPVTDLNKKHWSLTGRGTPNYDSKDEEVELPGRNLLLLSKAAVFCALEKIPTIALGSLSGNPFPDATTSFFRKFEQVTQQALPHTIKILTPFRSLKKHQLLNRAQGLPLQFSFSCLSPRGLDPCGQCNKCAERDKVLKESSHTH